MSKNIKINIHSSGSVKSEEIRTQGDHAEVVEAMRGARYELIDNDTGSVPEGISAKRVGFDLQVDLDGEEFDEPDLIVKDYFSNQPGYFTGLDDQGNVVVRYGKSFALGSDPVALDTGSTMEAGASGDSQAAEVIAGVAAGAAAAAGIAALSSVNVPFSMAAAGALGAIGGGAVAAEPAAIPVGAMAGGMLGAAEALILGGSAAVLPAAAVAGSTAALLTAVSMAQPSEPAAGDYHATPSPAYSSSAPAYVELQPEPVRAEPVSPAPTAAHACPTPAASSSSGMPIGPAHDATQLSCGNDAPADHDGSMSYPMTSPCYPGTVYIDHYGNHIY